MSAAESCSVPAPLPTAIEVALVVGCRSTVPVPVTELAPPLRSIESDVSVSAVPPVTASVLLTTMPVLAVKFTGPALTAPVSVVVPLPAL